MKDRNKEIDIIYGDYQELIENQRSGDIIGYSPEKEKYVSLGNHKENTLILGNPGSGKSIGYIIPSILKAIRRNENIFVFDATGEIYEHTKSIAKKMGYTIHMLNMKNEEQEDETILFEDMNYLELSSIKDVLFRHKGEGYHNEISENLYLATINYFGKEDNSSVIPLKDVISFLSTKERDEIEEELHLKNPFFDIITDQEFKEARGQMVYELYRLSERCWKEEKLKPYSFDALKNGGHITYIGSNRIDDENYVSVIFAILYIRMMNYINASRYKPDFFTTFYLDEYSGMSDILKKKITGIEPRHYMRFVVAAMNIEQVIELNNGNCYMINAFPIMHFKGVEGKKIIKAEISGKRRRNLKEEKILVPNANKTLTMYNNQEIVLENRFEVLQEGGINL